MTILELKDLELGLGGPPLLEDVDLRLEEGERVCLVGRNGSGKSTLMRVIDGELEPDHGQVIRRRGLVTARLPQEVPQGLHGPVFQVVADGLGAITPLINRYHDLSRQLSQGDPGAMAPLEQAQHALEAAGGWRQEQRVETVLSRLKLDPDQAFETLSGGLKRRVLLARALVQEPDLLLLDEPTNHLDIQAIAWLEEFLLGFSGSLLFITHDRALIRRLATRIVELDRGRLTSWPGDYDTYLKRRTEALSAEEQARALVDRKLAAEEAWIRQGIKARRTRNEGRVRDLQALREQVRARRSREGVANLRAQDAERSGRLVIEARHVTYRYGGEPIVRDLSTTILRGDKVGIIGPNGCGKTTLLNLLLGKLQPDEGTVRLGTRLEVAYFDQHRAQLDENATVLDNVAEGREQILQNGKPRHVISYLQDFLFPPERCRTPVSALSGGERNRLLLARLFTRPANLLVLDEPTNDLDTETLELLEELLLDFQGSVMLVSHDRAFLDNVVTSSLVFEGSGIVREYVGGYQEWLRQRPRPPPPETAKGRRENRRAPRPRKTATKLSYKDQRELDALPARIEALEAEQQALHEAMSDPGFYQREGPAIAKARERLAALEVELADIYARWESLEAMRDP